LTDFIIVQLLNMYLLL